MKSSRHYEGLSQTEVLQSREQHGQNLLTTVQRESLWHLYFEKFRDPIIIILLIVLLLISGITIYEYIGGEGPQVFFEPLGIFVAVMLATSVGFWFEMKARRAFDVLNRVGEETLVTVIRSGAICQIPQKDIVVGDIVMLNTGDEVCADGLLLESVSLQMNESTLTGEPLCTKTTDSAKFDAEATYPSNHVMKGTMVADGHGVMQVTAVGDRTEYGKVYRGSQIDNSVRTPLNEQLDRLGSMITRASYVIAILIVAAKMAFFFWEGDATSWIVTGSYLLQAVMIAVTIIVVAVPEGLPMSVTLSLALSMRRMLSTNNLVRKMHACETMGATTVICTDKTGTLTQNRMQVAQMNIEAEADLLPEAISTNSTAHLQVKGSGVEVLGNPTEGALLLWLRSEKSTDYLPLREQAEVVEQLTFSTERKYMATVVDSPLAGCRMLYVKGAPEYVLPFCTLTESDRIRFTAELQNFQQKAMRTLAFACLKVDSPASCFAEGRLCVSGLTLQAIAGIADPVREEVPAAVEDCICAGIKVKVVTGDTSLTAREIGRNIGLWTDADTDENLITGPEFAALTDDEARLRVQKLKIMSRARPMDKQRLVHLLQEQHEVVAVTGDGTNDAPALKAAHVGLSMGDGTSVAKEASDITIIDNSFGSISRAVMWGRSLYKNIQRFVLFQMTINVAACLIVLIGAFLGTDSPLTVTQMLWVNLIMDTFAAMALASLPPDRGVMLEHPRRREANIISRPMARRILGIGLAFVLVLFGLLQYFKLHDVTSLGDFSLTAFLSSYVHFAGGHHELSAYELSLFFTIFVMLQFWNMFNAKAFATGHSAFHHLASCRGFLLIAVVIVVGQVFIVSLGGPMFNVVPLRLTDWALIIGTTSAVLWIGELARLFRKRMVEPV